MPLLNRLRDFPNILEVAYQFAERVVKNLNPLWNLLGYDRVDRFFRTPEQIAKGAIFNCRMCGQCTLHFTGMTCPMGCPKNIRNGPCGGVRMGGFCEVDPMMKCVWVEAYERSTKMKVYGGGIFNIQPPLNQRLQGKSAFINLLSLQDASMPEAWKTETGLTHDRE